ncbi:MAG: hypothetical protein ACR2RV_09300 [Verrucomicrobiales bacterium]
MDKPLRTLFPVAVVGWSLAFSGCSDSTGSNVPDSDLPHQTLRGAFDLFYTLQTSPSTTEGTGSEPEKVSAIHFHETYIVVEDSNSGGRVFPIDKIKSFTWR